MTRNIIGAATIAGRATRAVKLTPKDAQAAPFQRATVWVDPQDGTLRHFGGGSELRPPIELCALYWHFLLIIWLALFGLLLADNGGPGAVLQPMRHMH